MEMFYQALLYGEYVMWRKPVCVRENYAQSVIGPSGNAHSHHHSGTKEEGNL